MRSCLRVAFIFAIVAAAGHAAAALTLAGASTMLPLAREAALHFRQDADIRVDVRGGGSEAGIHAAAKGLADIAMVARPLSADEARTLVAHPVALDGIAVIVNARNPVHGLSDAQVRGLFSGRVADWRELGVASGGATIPVFKAPGQSARLMFDAHFGVGGLLPPRVIELGSNMAVLLYVSVDPAAVGYVSIGALEEAKRRGLKVRGVAIDGVEPRIAECVARRYPICRPLQFVTRGTASDQARRFIEYFAGPEGRAIVEHHGFAAAGSVP